MKNAQPPSRISVPPRAHPLVRELYRRMAELGVGYQRLEAESGVKESTFKAWRCRNSITPKSIQAALRVVKLRALPVPRPDILPADLLAELYAIGERHGIPLPIAEFIMVATDRTPAEVGHG